MGVLSNSNGHNSFYTSKSPSDSGCISGACGGDPSRGGNNPLKAGGTSFYGFGPESAALGSGGLFGAGRAPVSLGNHGSCPQVQGGGKKLSRKHRRRRHNNRRTKNRHQKKSRRRSIRNLKKRTNRRRASSKRLQRLRRSRRQRSAKKMQRGGCSNITQSYTHGFNGQPVENIALANPTPMQASVKCP